MAVTHADRAAVVPFRAIVEFFDGPSRMARKFEVTTQALWQWECNGFPPLRGFQCEVLSKGRFRHNRVPLRAEKASAKGSSSRSASPD